MLLSTSSPYNEISASNGNGEKDESTRKTEESTRKPKAETGREKTEKKNKKTSLADKKKPEEELWQKHLINSSFIR